MVLNIISTLAVQREEQTQKQRQKQQEKRHRQKEETWEEGERKRLEREGAEGSRHTQNKRMAEDAR